MWQEKALTWLIMAIFITDDDHNKGKACYQDMFIIARAHIVISGDNI